MGFLRKVHVVIRCILAVAVIEARQFFGRDKKDPAAGFTGIRSKLQRREPGVDWS
jgi:hypothetical protein